MNWLRRKLLAWLLAGSPFRGEIRIERDGTTLRLLLDARMTSVERDGRDWLALCFDTADGDAGAPVRASLPAED